MSFIPQDAKVYYEVVADCPDGSTELLDSGIELMSVLSVEMTRNAPYSTVKYYLHQLH